MVKGLFDQAEYGIHDLVRHSSELYEPFYIDSRRFYISWNKCVSNGPLLYNPSYRAVLTLRYSNDPVLIHSTYPAKACLSPRSVSESLRVADCKRSG